MDEMGLGKLDPRARRRGTSSREGEKGKVGETSTALAPLSEGWQVERPTMPACEALLE